MLISYWIAWPTAAWPASKRVLFFAANFSYGRIKILPKRLYWGCIFIVFELLVSPSHFVCLIINVCCKLFLYQILVYPVNLCFSGMCLAHVHRGPLRWTEPATSLLTLRMYTFVRVRVRSTAADCTVFINTMRAFRYLLQSAPTNWELDRVATRDTNTCCVLMALDGREKRVLLKLILARHSFSLIRPNWAHVMLNERFNIFVIVDPIVTRLFALF